jgi:hypothetical protein
MDTDTTTCNEQFAKTHGLKVGQVKHLKGLINKHVRCWIAWNNKAGNATRIRAQQLLNMEQRAHETADAYAKLLGFTLDWSVGLYPTPQKDGKTYYLSD